MSRSQKSRTPGFLQKVVEILDAAPANIACWSRLGDSFQVKDPKRFSREYLAKHFKSAQFSSFVRQLNFYGFHKLNTDGKKQWEFKHACFIRNREDLMANIKRKTSAEYHTANKGEVADLRQKVGALTGAVGRANAANSALVELLKHMCTRDEFERMSVPEHVAEALSASGIHTKVGSWDVPKATTAKAPKPTRSGVGAGSPRASDRPRKNSATIAEADCDMSPPAGAARRISKRRRMEEAEHAAIAAAAARREAEEAEAEEAAAIIAAADAAFAEEEEEAGMSPVPADEDVDEVVGAFDEHDDLDALAASITSTSEEAAGAGEAAEPRRRHHGHHGHRVARATGTASRMNGMPTEGIMSLPTLDAMDHITTAIGDIDFAMPEASEAFPWQHEQQARAPTTLPTSGLERKPSASELMGVAASPFLAALVAGAAASVASPRNSRPEINFNASCGSMNSLQGGLTPVVPTSGVY